MTPAERAAALELTERVGLALRKLGLGRHVAKARDYYAALRAGGPEPRPPAWDHAMIVTWAELLRLPPYENALRVMPRCSTCVCDYPQPYTLITFPGGKKARCGACAAVWLELDDS